jgi:hypothetical protein
MIADQVLGDTLVIDEQHGTVVGKIVAHGKP